MGLIYKYQVGGVIKQGFNYGFMNQEIDPKRSTTVMGAGKVNPKSKEEANLVYVNLANDGANKPAFNEKGEFMGGQDVNVNVLEGNYKTPSYKGVQGTLGLGTEQVYNKWFKTPFENVMITPGLLYNKDWGKNSLTTSGSVRADFNKNRFESGYKLTPEARAEYFRGLGNNTSLNARLGYNREGLNTGLSLTKRFQQGGELIDTQAMKEDVKKDPSFYKNGIYTNAGRKRLASIQTIEDDQKAGLLYKKEGDTFSITPEGNEDLKRGLGVNETGLMAFLSPKISAQKDMSKLMAAPKLVAAQDNTAVAAPTMGLKPGEMPLTQVDSNEGEGEGEGEDIEFLEALKKQENGSKTGFKNGKWYPHESVEGGNPTIAYGHKLTDEELEKYKDGITTQEAEELFKKDFYTHKEKARSVFNSKFGPGSFGKLNRGLQNILADYSFNGVLRQFPRFMEAIYKGDKDAIIKNYKRYMGSSELTSRNEWTLQQLKNLL